MFALRVAVLAVVGVAALTATGIRVGDHPAYVRVVVDFNGKVPANQVEFGKLAGTVASVQVNRPGIKAQVTTRTGDGVRVALQPGTDALHISMSFAGHRFKYLSYAVVTGNRLAIDLWKTAPSSRGTETCSGLILHAAKVVKPGLVSVWGHEHGIFENHFRVVLRGASGRVLGQRSGVRGPGEWNAHVRYKAKRLQKGTVEAVAFSPKDNALECLAQGRITLPAS